MTVLSFRAAIATLSVTAFTALTLSATESSGVAAPGTPPVEGREWEADTPCSSGSQETGLTEYEPPVETNIDGCFKAHCMTAKDAIKVCLCAVHSPDEGKLIVEQAGKRLQEIDTEVFSWIGPGSRFFDALTGDLDGDGRPELVVPHLLTVSLGMGCDFWSVTIFDGRDLARPPVDLPVTEYGRHGVFLRSSTQGPCRILSTAWERLTEASRGEGLYLVGTWYTYHAGRIIPDTSRPVLARRYLYSFQSARNEAMSDDWYTSTKPFRWFLDPRTTERLLLHESGEQGDDRAVQQPH